MTEFTEARYVSRWAIEPVGLIVHVAGQVADADNNSVLVSMLHEVDPYAVEDSPPVPPPIFTDRPAQHVADGTYEILLSSNDTTLPGRYEVQFDYAISGTPQAYVYDIEIGQVAPDYDRLDVGWKMIVEQVWQRFADAFDSPFGGPYLQVFLQSHFGRNRVAQLLRQAVGRLNSLVQPYASYSIDVDNFPFDMWGPLVVQALYVEVIKHLIRSYVEIPDTALSTAISREERRDYMNRWEQVLDLEMRDLQSMTSNFKMQHMGLGNVSVLVSGGAYGRFGPTAFLGGVGAAAARGYYYGRVFY